ncbi:MAG TPA: CHRD domain-containing protein [Chitinophagaceae bacterium]
MKQLFLKFSIIVAVIMAFGFTGKNTINSNKIIACYIIELDGSNEVPQVNTGARGIAIIRVTAERQLLTKVVAHRLDASKDGALTAAYIHAGAAGSNGPVLVTMAAGSGDFDQDMAQWLTANQYQALLNDPIYVNVYSTANPSGLIRGQMR